MKLPFHLKSSRQVCDDSPVAGRQVAGVPQEGSAPCHLLPGVALARPAVPPRAESPGLLRVPVRLQAEGHLRQPLPLQARGDSWYARQQRIASNLVLQSEVIVDIFIRQL